jgi:hypothetical protein
MKAKSHAFPIAALAALALSAAPVDFQVSGGPGTLTVVATISSSEAAAGKLFGRLKASE